MISRPAMFGWGFAMGFFLGALFLLFIIQIGS